MAGALTSCYDLQTEPVSGTITEEERSEIFEKNPESISALSDGVYYNYYGFQLCYGDYMDFGYPGIMLQLDSRTASFVSANPDLYGWFYYPVAYLDNTPDNGYSVIRWRFPYNLIYTSNQVLSSISPETTDGTSLYYRAQAYGNRAFAYWMLAQLYQFNYVGHQNDPCVPIITDLNEKEVAENGAPRASVQEVYDQILSDLNSGIELMLNNGAATRTSKKYLDVNVLYGLRARTYLCMQDYDNAAADAQRVINSGEFTPLSSTEAIGPGFIDIDSPNWIWGIYYSVDDVMGLYTLAGFMGSYTYGYAYAGEYKLINSATFARISDNDPRKMWWINPNGTSNADTYKAADGNAAAYLTNSGFPTYSVVKFAPYGNELSQAVNQADVPLMRIEEMYYILAEAQGMSGNLAQGKATLENFVNSYRWLNSSNPYTCSAATADEFIDEIFFQRSVEFWGEGMTYYDIMRLNRGVDRSGSNWTDRNLATASFAYIIRPDNPVLLSQIPLSEIDNNEQLSSKDQNPTGSASL